MSDTTQMEVDPQIQKEEENVQKLLEKAKENIKAVKEKNEKEVNAAKEKARLALVKPQEALKAALLYKRALKAKKRHLGIELPMSSTTSKVNFRMLIQYTCFENNAISTIRRPIWRRISVLIHICH